MAATYDPRLAIPDYTAPLAQPPYLTGFAGTATPEQLADAASLVNIEGKAEWTKVWDITNRRALRAQGAGPGDAWLALNGSGDVRPLNSAGLQWRVTEAGDIRVTEAGEVRRTASGSRVTEADDLRTTEAGDDRIMER